MAVFAPTTQVRQPQAIATVSPRQADPTRSARAVQQGTGDLLKTTADIQLDRQVTRNAERVFAAEAELGQAYQLYETDVKNNRIGADAHGAVKDSSQWWDEQMEKLTGGLENDAQRKLFTETATRSRVASLGVMAEHEAVQTRAALNASADAAIKARIGQSAANPTDFKGHALASEDIQARITVVGKRSGWTDDVVKSKQLEATTSLHREVLENLVDRDPAAARDYFNANKDEIDGTYYDTIDDFIKTGDVKGRSQEYLDKVISSGVTQAQANAKARKDLADEPELREAAIALIDQHFIRERQIKQNMDNEAINEADDVLAANNGDISKIPASLMGRLPWEYRKSLLTEVPLYTPEDVSEEISNLSLVELADTNIKQYKYKMSANDYAVLETMWTEVREGKYDTYSVEKQIKAAQLAIDPDSTDKPEQKALFERKAREAIAVEQQIRGRTLLQSERQDIIDVLIYEDSDWGPNEFLFEDEVLGGRSLRQFATETLTEDFRAAAQSSAAAIGITRPLTEAELLKIWLANNGKGRDL